MMNPIKQSIRCPACHGPLQPVALGCPACGIKVEGQFVPNEFAALSDDDLHLLRIFIHTEGSIRDMESALGVSYPTIKARIAELKGKLAVGIVAPPTPPVPPAPVAPPTAPVPPVPPEPAVPAPPPVPAAPAVITIAQTTTHPSRIEILERLAAGTLTSAQATELLRRARH